MSTITEDYVSFEIAKLLKEKGFDAEIDTYYSPEGKFKIWCPNGLKSYIDNKGTETWWLKCIAPTLQMAMKWLREVHNLFIEIKYAASLFSQPHTTIYFQICYMSLDYNTSGKNMLPDDYIREDYTSYEEACEAAIKYCLENLI